MAMNGYEFPANVNLESHPYENGPIAPSHSQPLSPDVMSRLESMDVNGPFCKEYATLMQRFFCRVLTWA